VSRIAVTEAVKVTGVPASNVLLVIVSVVPLTTAALEITVPA
jgi:hypothetical protein